MLALPAQAVPLRLPPEMRRHYRIHAKDGTLLYTVTTINRFSEQQAESIALVRDEALMDVAFRSVLSFEKQFFLHRISDLKDEAYVQQTFAMPLGVKTWSEMRELMSEHQSIRQAEVILKLETNGGRWEYAERERKEPVRMRELRHNIRSSMSPLLLEAIERMRGTLFGTEIGRDLYTSFETELLYDAADEPAASTEITLDDSAPDCAFDASFGYPCTKSQLARIDAAAKEGKQLRGYW